MNEPADALVGAPSFAAGEFVDAWFASQALAHPGRLAIAYGSRQYSYGDLKALADSIAGRLIRSVPNPDTVIGIFMPPSPEFIVGLLGILDAGLTYTALDTAWPLERTRAIAADAAVKYVVTTSGHAAALRSVSGAFTCIDVDALDAASPRSPRRIARTPDNLAYLAYTSGSTGRPKGVMVSHRSLSNYVAFAAATYCREVTAPAPLVGSVATDLVLTSILPPLVSGGAVVVFPHDNPVLALADQLRAGCEFGVVKVTPSHLRLLESALSGVERIAVQRLIVGGEQLDRQRLAFWLSRTNATIINEYGPTETTVGCTYYEVNRDSSQTDGPVPIGRPLPGTSLHVLGAGMQAAARGQVGELFVGGAGVARGYCNAPALTASRFVPDSSGSESSGRLYRTGDVGYLDDGGNLVFVGRADRQLKIRGHRVEPEEVEHVLRQHPAVAGAVVVAHKDREVEGLVAFVSPASRDTIDPRSVTEFVADRLPRHLVPYRIEQVSEFPLTPGGKVDLSRLVEYRQAPPARGCDRATEAERDVAQVWSDVLGIADPPLDSTFFSLGGDSILAIQAAIRLRSRGYQLVARQLFDAQTIRQLAATVAAVDLTTAEPEIAGGGAAVLTPIQQWFFEQGFADWRYWNHALRLTVPVGATFEMVEQAVHQLIASHEIFQWRFKHAGEGVTVEWHPPRLDVVTRVDLANEGDTSAALRAVVERQHSRIDPAAGELIDVTLIERRSEPPLFSIVAHHLAVDLVSWQILRSEFDTLLQAALAGRRGLIAKETPFSLCTAALARAAAEKASESGFWLTLTGPQDPLPCQVSSEPPLEESSCLLAVAVPRDVTDRFKRKCARMLHAPLADATLGFVLLGLRDELNVNTMHVDLEHAGRPQLAGVGPIDSTVGWLTAVYPARFAIGGARDVIDAVCRVRQGLAAIPDKGIGYGLLRYLSPDPDLRTRMAAIPASHIRYNHLGNVSLADFAGPAGEIGRGKGNHRPYLLEFDSWVASGAMTIRVSFSNQQFDRGAIERLLARIVQEIDRFVAESDASPARAQLVTLQSLDVEDRYALSPLQRGILFDLERDLGASTYFVQLSAMIEGELDVAAFGAAWQQVVDDEPVLRTSFKRSETGEPFQRVHAAAELPFVVQDWSARPGDVLAHDMERYLLEDRRRGFDVAIAPLMRVHLVRLDATRFWLVWSHHHTILDGWSLAPLLRNVLEAYGRITSNRAALGPSSGRYRDYIDWLSRADPVAAERFWRRRLADLEPLPPLTMMRTVAAPELTSEDPYARAETVLPAEAVARLRAFVRDRNLTLNTLFQAAWSLVLSRLARTDDVVFGAVVSGRPADLTGVEHLLGLFINTIPVRVRLGGDLPVLEWLRAIEIAQREAEPFQYCSLADLHAWAGLTPPARMFDSVLVFENYPGPESVWRELGGCEISDVRSYERTTYAITIGIHLTDGIRLTLTYARHRFDEASCRQLLDDLAFAVTALASNAHRPLPEVTLRPPEESSALVDVPDVCDISEAIAAHAAQRPEATALRWDGRTLSFRELSRQAGAISRGLANGGLRAGGRVLMVDQPGPLEVAVVVAVLQSSAAFTIVRPDAPPSHLVEVFEQYAPSIVVVSDAVAEAGPLTTFLRQRMANTTMLSWSSIARFVEELDGGGTSASGNGALAAPSDADDWLAYVAYTSGTTGRPKGIAQHRRAVAAFVSWFIRAFDIGPGKRVAQWAPLSYDAGDIEVLATLAAGATLCLLDRDEKYVPSRLTAALAHHRVTHLQTTPSMMTQVVAQCAGRPSDAYRLDTLEHILLAGEAVSPALVCDLRAVIGAKATVVNLYGPAETILATYHRVGDAVQVTDRTVPIGTAIPRRRVTIVDHHLRPVPPGVVGEIAIESPDIPTGYLSHGGGYDSAFGSAIGGTRVYRTGDLGRDLGSGVFEFAGRADTQIKLRGMRLDVEGVEAVLRRHPAVADALVAAVEHAPGDVRLTAYVVAKAGGDTLPYAEMRRHVRQALPDAFVPSVLRTVASLPRTWNGKLDRSARLESGDQPDAAPRTAVTAVETALLIMWRLLLHADVGGVDDSFLDHGGHSLLAAQLLARVERVFGVQVSLEQFFEAPTIRFLSGVIAASEEGPRRAEAFLRNWDLVSRAAAPEVTPGAAPAGHGAL